MYMKKNKQKTTTTTKIELLLRKKKMKFKGSGETKLVSKLDELNFKILKLKKKQNYQKNLSLTLEHQVSIRRSYILNKSAAESCRFKYVRTFSGKRTFQG